MSRPIINIADLDFQPSGRGATDMPERFGARIGDIGRRLGAQKLGYNLTVVPPGKRAFPFHSHRTNEEMFFVVEGEGEVRIGDERFPIRRGDVIACATGGPETAHQIINTSDADLTYLAVSTRIYPELCEYPDSGKFGVIAEAKSPDGTPQIWRHVGRPESNLSYWDGEEG
jgi:uncharacterized cupin superfamily protein